MHGGSNGLWFYNTPVSFEDSGFTNGTKTIGNKDNTTGFGRTASSALDAKALEQFQTYYDNYNGKTTQADGYTIDFFAQPNFLASDFSGTEPTNCVWFKPGGAGKCALAFLHRNNSGEDYMSIYRFKRLDNGNIDTSSIKEIRFCLSKKLNNYCVAYFECDVSQAEYEAGYEFAIAWSQNQTSGTNPGFFYMLLAASDTAGGTAPGGKAKVLEKVEFVVYPDQVANFADPEYVVDATDLQITGTTTSANTSLHFDEFPSDHLVHYTSGGGLTVTEMVGANYESKPATAQDSFDPRQTQPTQAP